MSVERDPIFGLNPNEVTLALKLAYLHGSWDAISEIIHSLEDTFGEVSLTEIARQNRAKESMEAEDAKEEAELVVIVDWHPKIEA